MATASLTTKDEFRNTTEGWIGAVTLDARGESHGIAVAPLGTCWLSEEEQILTANAPTKDEDNPFVNGTLELVTRAREVKNRRPYGEQDGPPPPPEPKAQPQPEPEVELETGAAQPPAGEELVGEHAPTEEVGTPEAPAAAGKRRRARGA